MIVIGVDFHPEFQEIASVDSDTGDDQEKHLTHPGEAEQFYRALASVGQTVRVGVQASGHERWFERLLEEMRIELWRGDATVIRAKRGRKQKTDREDARHILKLLLKDDFPRIWGALRDSTTQTLSSLPFNQTGIIMFFASTLSLARPRALPITFWRVTCLPLYQPYCCGGGDLTAAA